MKNIILIGDVIEQLKNIPDQVVNTCVTSPPYWGLRSYLPDRVILKNDTPESVIRELEKLGIFPLDRTG